MPTDPADLLVLSNRGPVTFQLADDGTIRARRAGGGLVVVVGPGVAHSGARWLAATTVAPDRSADPTAAQAFGDIRHVVVPPELYQPYYDVIANGTLWYLFHGLWDHPRRPRFDRRWRQAWAAYQHVNELFAAEAATHAAPGALVVVQDYHLALVPPLLTRSRPDLRVEVFVHTPWCSPDELAVLPDTAAAELMSGMTAAQACGFHAPRWAEAFDACCRELDLTAAPAFSAPAAPNRDDLVQTSLSAACTAAEADLRRLVGDRRLIVRVDRMEPSKNVLRGFWAYDELLETRPDLRGQVCFAAMTYPSRQGLADYLAYGQEVEGLAHRINDRWGRPGWTPILLDTTDNYARSVAALRHYDVLLVNPIRDGLNLVAKEGPLVNQRSGTVVLSRQAGCFHEIGDSCLGINPFDVSQTASALGAALDAGPEERANRATALVKVISARTPLDWWGDLLAAAPAQT